jgi:hypothetical protein
MSDITRIEALMDDMQRALIAADYTTLQRTTALLEAATAQVRPQWDRATLERLRRRADRNAACALAAGRGVRAALNRLTEIRQAAAGLVTYDEKGKRASPAAAAGLNRRF